jgi:hypothetical protein
MKIIELMFGDDCALLVDSAEQLQKMLDIFDEISQAFSMQISMES